MVIRLSRIRAGMLLTVVIPHLHILRRRHLLNLAPRRRRRPLNDIAVDRLNKVVLLIVADVNEEVGICRDAGPFVGRFTFGRGGEDLVDVGDVGDVLVVVFAPDLFDSVEDVDPVVAEARGPTVEECSV